MRLRNDKIIQGMFNVQEMEKNPNSKDLIFKRG
ncbi:hypothetical protein CLV93_1082 [Prolixibacter denitrificans]|uniref:Uncharacterized protein n=1 Tax=Prolixibacter denitrificans TaxID=1541063 RepID=A0A2P8C9G8_9BACT|nr:hypothetical protein CLV93_1082 [Prolixibacter denitrificans]